MWTSPTQFGSWAEESVSFGVGPLTTEPDHEESMTHTAPAEEHAASGHPRLRRTLKWLAVILALLVVAGAATGFYLYQRFEGNIGKVDVFTSDIVGTDRPTKAEPAGDETEPLNILVMGSDTRAGQGKGYGPEAEITGARSDTTLLVHLPADRESALVVSIPRDTVLDIPSCKNETGVIGSLHRPLQLRLLDRWARLHDQDRRAEHRGVHRPLRHRRLLRLQRYR